MPGCDPAAHPASQLLGRADLRLLDSRAETPIGGLYRHESAVASISKNLAKTYGGQGLRVNCIAPGIIVGKAGPAEKSIVGKGGGLAEKSDEPQRSGVPPERARYESVRREFGMTVALERAGRHEEFADLIAYLLSERASYISGATINIDGGTDF